MTSPVTNEWVIAGRDVLWVKAGVGFVPTTAASKFLDNSSVQCCFTTADHKDHQGRGAQDGHLHFHTAPELCPN